MPRPSANAKRTHRLLFALTLAMLASLAWAQEEPLEVTYLKSDASFNDYYQFILSPLDLSDTRLIPPPWVEEPDPRQWQLSKENRDFLKAAYALAVRQGIEASGEFNVVRNPTPGTLQLDMRLISLEPYAARGEEVTTRGFGTLSFEAQVRDARSGELLAVFQGNQQVGQDYQENTDFNKASNLAQHFNDWGHNISRRLAAAHEQ